MMEKRILPLQTHNHVPKHITYSIWAANGKRKPAGIGRSAGHLGTNLFAKR